MRIGIFGGYLIAVYKLDFNAVGYLKTTRQYLEADDFMMAFQEITTEWCWGYAWTRPGLDRKTRSMLNLAMLTALKAPNEIKLHVKGALTNGVTVDEIKEILLHATVYSGIPAGLEAFKAAHEVLKAEGVLEKK